MGPLKNLGLISLLVVSAAGKELPVNEVLAAEMYDSGVVHELLMAKKMVGLI